jgi:cell division septum initiation protein DivIVA
MGRGAQDSLERRLEAEEAGLGALDRLAQAVAGARDAIGERTRALEAKVLGGDRDADDVTEELRACSRREANTASATRSGRSGLIRRASSGAERASSSTSIAAWP